MKLLRLKITDPKGFRCLQAGFEYQFRSDWDMQEEQDVEPFVCAGPNGSGKSNMLEALAVALDCRPGDLISRNPLVAGEIIDLFDSLPDDKKLIAREMLEALKRAG